MIEKINDFTSLIVWQKAHELVLMIYKATYIFPKNETYALIPQLRRCSVSVTSNIAEGFGRQSKKEKIQFYFMASGSLLELRNQLIIARDLSYINKLHFEKMNALAIEVNKLIHGLIKSIKLKF